MSPLAENIATQIRHEVAGKVEHRNRLFKKDDGFLLSRYVTPRRFTNKNVDSKRNRVQDSVTKNKNMKTVLKVGDYLQLYGITHMTVWVDETKARIAQATGHTTIISRSINSHFVVPNCTEADLNAFLTHNALSLEKLNTKPAGEEKDETVTATKKVEKKLETGRKSPPRGGLAAEVEARKLAEKAKTSPKRTRKATPAVSGDKNTTDAARLSGKGRTKGRCGALFGHSLCHAMRGAGAAGVTYEQAKAYLKENSILMGDATLIASIRVGRNGKMDGANLTTAQIDEIKAALLHEKA